MKLMSAGLSLKSYLKARPTAPMSWLTYFGMMKVDSNEDGYECYFPEKEQVKNFAKRIFKN